MEVLLSITLFALVGIIFVFANLTVGSLVRPWLPNASKSATYECGEVPIGNSWVQFDLRFYIIALVYLVFDVEVALFYPWAVAYGANPANRPAALVDMLFFFGVLLVGYAYLWKFGYLDWVRSAATTTIKKMPASTISK
jgi:NADH-quinone oxidoreductase subunit A